MFREWAYAGVDHSIPGNGGPECVGFMSPAQRLVESMGAAVLGLWCLRHGLRGAAIESRLLGDGAPTPDRGGKRALTVFLSLIFGMEIGFKLASRTVVYILNPCHLITFIQIILLAAPPSRVMTSLFRLHIHCLNGALLALLFPILNTRLLPFEQEVYWLQHVLILVIPFYLIRTGMGGVYTVEPLRDLSWCWLALGFMLLYHFLLLQLLGLLTEVNLNNMLCPGVSDPFYGPWYRLFAICHQTVLILTVGKAYTWVSLWALETLGSLVWTGERYINRVLGHMHRICTANNSSSTVDLRND